MSILQTQSTWTKLCSAVTTTTPTAPRARSASPVQQQAAAPDVHEDHEDFAFDAVEGAKSPNRQRVHHFYRVKGGTMAARSRARGEAGLFKPLRRHAKPEANKTAGRRKPGHGRNDVTA